MFLAVIKSISRLLLIWRLPRDREVRHGPPRQPSTIKSCRGALSPSTHAGPQPPPNASIALSLILRAQTIYDKQGQNRHPGTYCKGLKIISSGLDQKAKDRNVLRKQDKFHHPSTPPFSRCVLRPKESCQPKYDCNICDHGEDRQHHNLRLPMADACPRYGPCKHQSASLNAMLIWSRQIAKGSLRPVSIAPRTTSKT